MRQRCSSTTLQTEKALRPDTPLHGRGDAAGQTGVCALDRQNHHSLQQSVHIKGIPRFPRTEELHTRKEVPQPHPVQKQPTA